MCLALGPQRSDAGEARTCGPSVSSQALYHRATALPRSTSENVDIFTARNEIYLVFAKKKVNFLFILYSTEIQKAQPKFFLGRFSFYLIFAVCLLRITLGVNVVCT